MKSKRRFVIAFLVLYVVFLPPMPSVAVGAHEAYEAHGSLEQRWLKTDLSWGTTTNWFWAVVSNCNCIIRTGGMADNAVEYFEYWSDGVSSTLLTKYAPSTNVFVAARPFKNGVSLKTNSVPYKVLNDATLIINHGVIPEYGFGLITPVWLALASSCFYQSAVSNKSDPVIFIGAGFRESNLKVASRWHLADTPPRLLEWMCTISDGYRYHEEHDTLIKERLPSPFNKSFTNAWYSVLNWTNVNGLVIPRDWTLIQLRPSTGEDVLETNMITSGRTQKVFLSRAEQDLGLPIPPNTRVLDRTLPSQGIPIRECAYFTTNGQLLGIGELKKQLNFPLMLADARQSAYASTRRRAVLAVSLVLLCFPVAMVLWRSRHRQTN
jgi:hypothetical protein